MLQLDDRRWNRFLNYIQLPKQIIQGQTTESSLVFAWHRIFPYSLRLSLFRATYTVYKYISDGLIDSQMKAAVNGNQFQFHTPKFNIALERAGPSQKETSSSKLHGKQGYVNLNGMNVASDGMISKLSLQRVNRSRTFLLKKVLCAAGAYSASGLLWWWSAAAGRNLCFIVPLSFASVPYHNRVFQHVVTLCSSIRSSNFWKLKNVRKHMCSNTLPPRILSMVMEEFEGYIRNI